jgi:hypothetical protein
MSRRTNVLRASGARYVWGMQQIRRSNAAGPHDPRPNRRRSRGDARRAAIRESA